MPTDGNSINSSSPKNRLKFLCSHGGKILPRPADGHLKYVGGETRVISLPRDIPFQEVMKRLTYLIDGEMILKYQLVSEDLDALVSVKSDEDLLHMFDEIEHYETAGCPKMRAFLFPVNHVVMENQTEPLALDQRYIYSINGINTKQLASLASSACTSPRSPDCCTPRAAAEAININNVNAEAHVLQNNYQNSATSSSTTSMHKIQSSPNICNNVVLNVPPQSTQYVQLQYPQQYYHNSPNQPFDTHRNAAAPSERALISVRSVGRSDGIRLQVDTGHPPQYYYASRENVRGSGCGGTICIHHDTSTNFPGRRSIIDRQETLP